MVPLKETNQCAPKSRSAKHDFFKKNYWFSNKISLLTSVPAKSSLALAAQTNQIHKNPDCPGHSLRQLPKPGESGQNILTLSVIGNK
jgi:hypothetical protein